MRTVSILLLLSMTLLATPFAAGSTPDLTLRTQGVYLTPARIAEIKSRIENRVEPTYSAAQGFRETADASLEREPHLPASGEWNVPGFYRDREGHRALKAGLEGDANAAYALGLMYRLTGEERYATAAARLILAWTTVRQFSHEADSSLTLAYHLPALIFAADLIHDSSVWTEADEQRFVDFLSIIVIQARHPGGEGRWPVWAWDNNWGNWGNVLGMATAVYVRDRPLFDAMIERWKHLTRASIAEDGHLPKEVSRNRQTPGSHGLWYSHFALQPHTIAAEIARVNGVDLFDYVSPSGRSLRLAYERLVPWVADLESFPYHEDPDKTKLHAPYAMSYFEILNPRWPNAEAGRLLRDHRPLTTQHSNPFTTVTHGDLPADL